MSGKNDLTLTSVETDDTDALVEKIESYYRQDSTVKSQLAWHWERNHLFLDGKQWLVFDGEKDTGGIWRRLRVSRQNEYIPRPTTNYIFDIYQTLKSYILKSKPRSKVIPNTNTFQDKSAAKVASLVLECNYARLKEQFKYEYACSTLITYGTVFKKDYWDTSVLSMARVPKMITVPKMDPQTQQIIGQEQVEMKDEMGSTIYEEIPLGDVGSKIIEPYRMAIDPLAMELCDELRWIMEYSIQPIDTVKANYDKQEDGYTGKVDELKAEMELSGSMRRFWQLKNSAGTKANNFLGDGQGAGQDVMLEDAVVVKEYYERPSSKYTKGRLIVVANNTCLYAGDSPYEGPELGDWHPYSECRWELVPGRFWGKSPFDDAVEIQKHVNAIDSVIMLVRKTSAIPQKLLPIGCGVSPGAWTGRPGQQIPYRDVNGSKPEIIPASGVDQQIFQERAQRLEDLKAITGAIDILKGDRPPGVTAASALNMLYEVGTGKLFPVLDRWKCFIETSQKKQLRIVARKYKEPRPDFIRLLKSRNSELSEQAIDKFLGEDLYDNCNVVVEAGSNIPKLQAAKQAMLMEVAQGGSLHLENPVNAREYHQQLGITGFDQDLEPDIKRAEWENDILDNTKNSPQDKPIILVSDKHEIHIAVHENRTKEPAFISLDQEVQSAYMQHIQQHEQFIQQAQQAQQMQQIAASMTHPGAPGGSAPPPQAGPGGPAPGPSQPMHQSGKGVSQKMKNSLFSDALPPGPVGGTGGH